MKYPTLSLLRCEEIVRERVAGREAVVQAQWIGDGEEMDLRRIADAARAIKALLTGDWNRRRDGDYVEGLAATHLYRALAPEDAPTVPVEVLDDPGFWRFLGLQYLWEFISWRELSVGKQLEYVNGLRSTECVPTRMYLRVAAVGGLEFAERHSERLKQATDFWRSHILRVRTGTAPALTRAIVSRQARQPLETDSLRPFAKRVNGAWTNVLLNMYDDAEAERFVDELWPDQT